MLQNDLVLIKQKQKGKGNIWMRDKGVKRGKKKKKWGGRKLYLVMWLVGWVQSEVHDILCHATTICVMEGTDNRRKCTFAYVCIIFCLRGGPKQRHAGPPPPPSLPSFHVR